MRKQIIALGGGGFAMEPDNPRLDAYLMKATRKRTPSVLFLPTASGDAESYQLKFFKAYAKLGARPAVLELFRFDRRTDIARAILESDLIFVGGGNTVAMLDIWRRYGVSRLLARAYARGAVMAGISAGANCWFERSVSDSVPGGGLIDGLGWLRGVFCPHFDGEAWRRSFCEKLIRREPRVRGFAADDGAALHFVDGKPWRAVCSAAGKRAWRLAGGIEPVPTRLLKLPT